MPSSTGDFEVIFDSDADGATNRFVIQHDGGGAGKDLFEVKDNSQILLHGALASAGPITFRAGATAPSNVVRFLRGGLRIASIDINGKGVFDSGGIRLPVVSSAPTSSGNAGDLILYSSGGTWRLYCCVGGTTWKYLAFP